MKNRMKIKLIRIPGIYGIKQYKNNLYNNNNNNRNPERKKRQCLPSSKATVTVQFAKLKTEILT